MIDKTFPHDRGARLDYVFDWEPWLTEEGDTIASVSWALSAGLTQVTFSNTTVTATIWVTIDSNVPKSRLLTIACKITTAGGRLDERTITVKASDL